MVFFRIHFIDQLNLKYGYFDPHNGTFSVSPYVRMILSALGLPDNNSVIKIHGLPSCQYTNRFTFENIIDNVPYFPRNGERNSIKSVDRDLANELYSIYGKYGFDGYIAPYAIPTRFECGWFNTECCVFNPSTCLISTHYYIQRIGKGSRRKRKSKLKRVWIPPPNIYVEYRQMKGTV